MRSLVARTAFISPRWPSALAQIWRNVEGSLLSSPLQLRSYSDEGLDRHVPACREASSSTAHLSGESPPGASTTLSFRANKSVDDRHAHGVRKYDANRVKINKRPASAATTRRAIAELKNRLQQGLSIGSYAINDALKQCSEQKDLIATKQLHDCIIQSGMDKDPWVVTTLLNVYIKCGRLPDARQVFDGLVKTDRKVITWNIMIAAYAKSGCGEEAHRLFLRMNREGFKPDTFTYASILNAAASAEVAAPLEWVTEVHSHAFKAGLDSDVRVGTALVRMYAKIGDIDNARVVFDKMKSSRDVFTWTVMIGAYAESGNGVKAYELFDRMMRGGLKPDAITFVSILNANAAASAGALEWVRDVHRRVVKAGLESDVLVGTALVRMYAKSGSVHDARIVFDGLKSRNKITWTVMIGAYADSGYGLEAYGLFLQMHREGFLPDAVTYVSILNAAASAGALEWVKDVHRQAVKSGLLKSDVRVGAALVHMYSKIGSIEDAQLVFDGLEERNEITWNVMIGALAEHGRGHEAVKLFKRMNAECVQPPDGVTFVAVLTACSHAGLVDDGRRLFAVMKQDYGVEGTVVHYNCMVDVLGRAGHLEEAKLLIDAMPMGPDAVTWTAFLGACRTHCNEDLGELAAEEVFKLQPNTSSAYVLLSNIYASTGRWEKVASVRKMMEERALVKEPGRSWIAVDNQIHEFVTGDTSHPEATAIYRMLEELTDNLKAKGYIPDTRLVLHNIDDEDKELALCSHSEKLAIAYGLLRVPREEPIRVEKNLRICSDCHSATKLISEVTGREIIAKDANRFHHFKDGVCSCGDYW